MSDEIRRAAAHLKSGHCVAMPTETVYGLAARVDSPAGISSIFRLKERPSFDPLIVHVASLDEIDRLTAEWPRAAASLAQAFWPGPLTLVVKKRPEINNMITSGLDTVGIRMPRHPIALALIQEAGAPLAAPSANRFGRTSPTSASHVANEFPDAVRSGEIQILDGGESSVGVESTVCQVTENEVVILRPGGVTFEDLVKHFAENQDPKLRGVRVTRSIGHHASPGHTEHHYETRKPLIVSWQGPLEPKSYRVQGQTIPFDEIRELVLPSEPALAARSLYALLRDGDQDSASQALFIRRDLTQEKNRTGLWAAIDDRLMRASRLQLGDGPLKISTGSGT